MFISFRIKTNLIEIIVIFAIVRSNNIVQKGIITLVNEVEVRPNRVNEGFFLLKN